MQPIGSLLPLLKMLQVPAVVGKYGTLVVPPLPTIVIRVLPFKPASKGMINYPTDLTSRLPAGGKITFPEMTRSCPMA
jgi:hypothetical protein